jgi:hypothetical protein
MSRLSPSEARDALVDAGITGAHQSHARADNIAKITAMLEGDKEATFGLSGITNYSPAEVLSFVADLTGCSPDISDLTCEDGIDPERTVQAIMTAARRLKAEARKGGTLLAVTGHPAGLLEHHARVVEAYRSAGGKPVTPGEDVRLPVELYGRTLRFRYNCSVGCVSDGANILHRHGSDAMEALLDSHPYPDVVLGDHGFAGAAIERGIPTIAIMDINDPALAIAAAEDRDVTIIPMDDNRSPRLYEPSWTLFEQELAS